MGCLRWTDLSSLWAEICLISPQTTHTLSWFYGRVMTLLGQSLAVTTGTTSTYSQTLAVSTGGTCTYGQILAEESHNLVIKSRQFMGWDLFDFTPDNPYTFLILWPGSDFLGQSLAVTTGVTSTYSQTLAVSTGGTCTYGQMLAEESHSPAIKSRQFMGWDLFTSDNPYTFLIYDRVLTSSAKVWP